MAITSPRASSRAYPLAPTNWGRVSGEFGEVGSWIRLVAETVNRIMIGKINNTGTVTLTASTTSTVLSDIRIGPDSHISLTPLHADAAATLATVYISSRGKQTATITHASDASVNQDFSYAVFG